MMQYRDDVMRNNRKWYAACQMVSVRMTLTGLQRRLVAVGSLA